jgi:DNA-binding GntR family transcriptional regulator
MPVSDPGFLGLVRQHIRSVWSLEVLLLLRSRPGETWRPEALVRELRASAPLIAGCLAKLQDSGLAVSEDGGWRFAPASPELERFCGQLAEAYQTRPVAVINMIASPSQVQDLANAFKFKGGDDR